MDYKMSLSLWMNQKKNRTSERRIDRKIIVADGKGISQRLFDVSAIWASQKNV